MLPILLDRRASAVRPPPEEAGPLAEVVDRDALAEVLALADPDREHPIDDQVVDLGDAPIDLEPEIPGMEAIFADRLRLSIDGPVRIPSCIDAPSSSAYDCGMRKHTTMDLDADLVAAAATVLGTSKIVDTVHAALSEVVRSRRRAGIVDFRPSLDLDDLDAMRAHRFAEARAPYGSESE